MPLDITMAETEVGFSALNTEKVTDGQVKRCITSLDLAPKKQRENRFWDKWLLLSVYSPNWGSRKVAVDISVFEIDPIEPETVWLNPYGVHFALLKVSDMVRVDEQGNRVGGADKPVNAAGFMIHSAVHKKRQDIHAAYSCMFYDDISVYPAFGGVVFAQEEGQRIAEYLGPTKKNLIMQNHGLLTSGGTVAEAAAFFIALERSCQNQLLVESSIAPGSVGSILENLKKTDIDHETALYTKKGTGSPEAMYMQFEPEYQLVLRETNGEFLP
ncbi:hypothetical protein N7507_008683 [Penicillium longicatenatum]|nr:hypothetical protein N7507_008683 [Penicillium longicatenatum]